MRCNEFGHALQANGGHSSQNGVHDNSNSERTNGHTATHYPTDMLKQSQNSMDLGSILQWTKSSDEERRNSNGLASTPDLDHFVSCMA